MPLEFAAFRSAGERFCRCLRSSVYMQIKIPPINPPSGGGGAGGSNPRLAGPDLSPHIAALMARLSALEMRVRVLEGRVAHQDSIIAALQRQSGPAVSPYPGPVSTVGGA